MKPSTSALNDSKNAAGIPEFGAAAAGDLGRTIDAEQTPPSKIKGPRHRSSVVATSALLNVAQVARHIGVSEKTVRRWIDSKILPAHRLGRLVRVSESDLNVFIRMSRDA